MNDLTRARSQALHPRPPLDAKAAAEDAMRGGQTLATLLVYRRAVKDSPARFEHYASCKGAIAAHALHLGRRNEKAL